MQIEIQSVDDGVQFTLLMSDRNNVRYELPFNVSLDENSGRIKIQYVQKDETVTREISIYHCKELPRANG